MIRPYDGLFRLHVREFLSPRLQLDFQSTILSHYSSYHGGLSINYKYKDINTQRFYELETRATLLINQKLSHNNLQIRRCEYVVHVILNGHRI